MESEKKIITQENESESWNPTLLPKTPQKKFRLKNQIVFLTYETHLDKEIYSDWLREKLNREAEINIAHESETAKTGYKHSHVLIETTKAIETENCRYFDYEGLHPNIVPISSKNKVHLNHVYAYMCKEDKDNLHLKEKITPSFKDRIESVMSAKDKVDAFAFGRNFSEIAGIERVYAMKPFEPSVTEEQEKWMESQPHWQKIHDSLITGYEHRKVMWIVDTRGNTGKTEFTHYMEDKYNAMCFSCFGGQRDAATIVEGCVDSGWKGNIIIADFPRDEQDHSIYAPIEAIKNGRITSTKFRGRRIKLPNGRPKLVIMANFYPKMGRMSADKWDIRDISHLSTNPPIEGLSQGGGSMLVASSALLKKEEKIRKLKERLYLLLEKQNDNKGKEKVNISNEKLWY